MANILLPRLIIVAGPNGAGKSSFSKNFSNANPVIFDPDKESQRIREKYEGLPAESIYYHIDQHFRDTMELAWKAKRDFILETNFRDYQLMQTVGQFREQGYQVELAYLLLPSENYSIDRVKTRVQQGGHAVDKDSIVFNYQEGLRNLIYFSDRFDSVTIVNASGRFGKLDTLLIYENKQLAFQNPVIPKWARQTVSDISGQIEMSDMLNLKPGDENTPKQGPKR